MPDRLSVPVSVTWTGPRYQPLSSGAGTPAAVVLPAASLAVPLTLWLAPSASVCGAGQVAIPDRLSAQVKPTVTSALYQPLALAARSAAALMVGAVLSMLTRTGSLAVLPALSTALPLASWSW